MLRECSTLARAVPDTLTSKNLEKSPETRIWQLIPLLGGGLSRAYYALAGRLVRNDQISENYEFLKSEAARTPRGPRQSIANGLWVCYACLRRTRARFPTLWPSETSKIDRKTGIWLRAALLGLSEPYCALAGRSVRK